MLMYICSCHEANDMKSKTKLIHIQRKVGYDYGNVRKG